MIPRFMKHAGLKLQLPDLIIQLVGSQGAHRHLPRHGPGAVVGARERFVKTLHPLVAVKSGTLSRVILI